MPAPTITLTISNGQATTENLTTVINNALLSVWAEAAAKAPASHTHAVGDVTNLQSLLDAKAAAAHSHAWADITGKPTTFTPAAHTHVISDVTGLQSALDAKAATNAIPTTEQLQDLVAAMFQGGTHTNASVTYDDAAGTLSVGASGGGTPMTQEQVEDFVGALIQVQGTGLTITYDDANNALRIGLAAESYTTAEKNKLAAIAAGATANSTDATLLARANHTGTQAIATVSGLQAALDAKAASTHTHAWGDITGKPTAFTAAAHSHSISEVTGLQSALDAKVGAVHTHALTDVTGLQAALDAKANLTPSITFGNTTSYTLVLADAGRIVTRNNAAASTLTIPADATTNFPAGTTIIVQQTGSGTATVVGAAGVTVNGVVAGSVEVPGRWQALTLVKHTANYWVVSGAAL